MIERYENWPMRLAEFIESRRLLPFTWGQNDCCLFAADAVLAMTGHDFAESFRGRYADEASATLELENQTGLKDVWRAVNKLLAAQQMIAPAFAQRGDVVAYTSQRAMLGVIDLSGSGIIAPGDTGLILVPRAQGRFAWRIG